MIQEPCASQEPLTRRLDLMRQLAESLLLAQAAVIQSNVRELEVQTTRQRMLCDELKQPLAVSPPPRLGEVRHDVQPSEREARRVGTAGHADDTSNALLRELAEVERQVAGLNQTYAALLRRASRTVEMFCRVLASSDLTYAPLQPTGEGRSEPCPVSMG